MVVALLKPGWFIGHDVLFEFVFALIAFFVGYYSYKVFKLSGTKDAKYFSTSFMLLSLAYLILSLTNLSTFLSVNNLFLSADKVQTILFLNNIGLYAHALLYALGIIYLTFTTFKNRDNTHLLLIAMLVLIPLIISSHKALLFYVITTLLLTFITTHYCTLYLRKKRKQTLIMLIAFALFLGGRIVFILSLNHGVFYVLGHLLELFAYILLLVNLLRVLRK